MRDDANSQGPAIIHGHSLLLLAASIMVCLLVTLGAVVCATESGAACPDWPGCYGRIVPPADINAIIEFTHRFVAALTTPVIVAAAVASGRRERAIRWVSRPPFIAIFFTLAVIVFGAFAVLTGLAPVPAALDLGSALTVLALLVTSTTVAFARRAAPALPDRLSLASPLARLSLAALAGTFLVYITGVLVSGTGSLTRCLGWTAWRIVPADLAGWPQPARLALSALVALLVIALVVQAWRSARPGAPLRRLALATGLALLAEMAIGVAMLAAGSNAFLLIVYVAVAAIFWGLLTAITVLAALDVGAAQAPMPSAAGAGGALRMSR